LHSGLLFRLKEKIRRIGGCKGRLPRVYLTFPPRGSKICFLVKKNEFLRTKIKRYTRVTDKHSKHTGTDDGRGSVLDHSNQSDRFLLCTLLVSQCIFAKPDP
jgi:hypothetical protein